MIVEADVALVMLDVAVRDGLEKDVPDEDDETVVWLIKGVLEDELEVG